MQSPAKKDYRPVWRWQSIVDLFGVDCSGALFHESLSAGYIHALRLCWLPHIELLF